MSVLEDIKLEEEWNTFLEYKKTNNHVSVQEEAGIFEFISQKRFLYFYDLINKNSFPTDFPHKKIINKEGSDKKRIVYSFNSEDNIVLKFIAYKLYKFDYLFSSNCYAFRRNYGVKNAINAFRGNKSYASKYCFKADIQNYFNSIDVSVLIRKMECISDSDSGLYTLLSDILNESRVYSGEKIVTDRHGAMAGIPVSPFFANIYLSDIDRYFSDRGIDYFRYSDDILIFADNLKDLETYRDTLYVKLRELGLKINDAKVTLSLPGQPWEFLGFSYDNGRIDLSANTKRKVKARIRRKAEALRRWQRKKGLSPDKAAIGFIHAMNNKFYGHDNPDDFSWNRWFFPNITEDNGLKEIDTYMQEYIRYAFTGRHYKGNFRISYSKLKEWGYRSLVHEYYKFKAGKD